MQKLIKAAVTLAGLLALLAGVGWLGLQVKPKPFQPYQESTQDMDTTEIPSGLPAPVDRYLRNIASERTPKIKTAVVWGRGEFNFFGVVWFPMRVVAYYDVPDHEVTMPTSTVRAS